MQPKVTVLYYTHTLTAHASYYMTNKSNKCYSITKLKCELVCVEKKMKKKNK